MRSISEHAFDSIKRLVESQKIVRVVYMHADHFEPWQKGVDQENADKLISFVEATNKTEYARRLSLFYKPQFRYNFLSELGKAVNLTSLDGEPIGFAHSNAPQADIAREAIQEIVRNYNHEFHVHLHHEGFTMSGAVHAAGIAEWALQHSNPEQDSQRFELALQMSLDIIRDESGLSLDRWAFVHGNWALNASDHKICRIADEMTILQRNGCFGDFTFPAGRSAVNPRIEHPFTCIPFKADRAYDLPSADARLVLPSSNVFGPDRFFIWSSVIKHSHCGIDYYSPKLLAALSNTDDIVLRWLRDSVHFDGTVYIKTHSHSMARPYWEALAAPIIPHLHPAIKAIFSQLTETCAKLDVDFEFGTAQSIFDELVCGATGTHEATSEQAPADLARNSR